MQIQILGVIYSKRDHLRWLARLKLSQYFMNEQKAMQSDREEIEKTAAGKFSAAVFLRSVTADPHVPEQARSPRTGSRRSPAVLLRSSAS